VEYFLIFIFNDIFLNLVLKGSPLNFYHIQNYVHFYIMHGNRYVYEFGILLFTYTISVVIYWACCRYCTFAIGCFVGYVNVWDGEREKPIYKVISFITLQ
jgi:hypothetical protein